MLRFEYPAALGLLLLIPLFYVLRQSGVFSPPSFPLTLSDWKGFSFNWKPAGTRFLRFISRLFFIGGFIALVVAISSPSVSEQKKIFTAKGAEIIFALDISPSMAALDMDGTSRLVAAKRTIQTIVLGAPGTAFGLTALAEEAALVVPPTLDHHFLLNRLGALAVGELGDGTALGTGISTAVYHLISSRSPQKSIVLLTDGENNAGAIHPNTAARLAAENAIALFVVGIGTRGKIALEYADPKTGKVYSGYFDSSFDAAPLKKLATEGNGAFYTAENPAQLADALRHISKNQTVEQSYVIRTAEKRYYAQAVLAAILLFTAAWLIRRLFMRELL